MHGSGAASPPEAVRSRPDAPVRSAPNGARPAPAAAERSPQGDALRQPGASATVRPAVAAPSAKSTVTRAESPDEDTPHVRLRPEPVGVVSVARREPPAPPATAPDRPVEVHIGTIEITAAAPPPRQARGPVGFAAHERLRTYAWDD